MRSRILCYSRILPVIYLLMPRLSSRKKLTWGWPRSCRSIEPVKGSVWGAERNWTKSLCVLPGLRPPYTAPSPPLCPSSQVPLVAHSKQVGRQSSHGSKQPLCRHPINTQPNPLGGPGRTALLPLVKKQVGELSTLCVWNPTDARASKL